MVSLARCETQDLCNTGTSDMNESQSWSLPSLNFLSADLTWFNLAWYVLTSDCLSWVLAFTVAKHDATSTTDAVDFSVFWTCSIKATTNDCKCLNVNRIHSKNFQTKLFRTTVGLSIDMKYEFEAGAIEASVASRDKVIAIWLRYEKQVFGTQYAQSHNSLFTLLCELCKCNHTYFAKLQNTLVFDRAARVLDRIFAPLDSL